MHYVFISLSVNNKYSRTGSYPHIVFVVFIKTTGVTGRDLFKAGMGKVFFIMIVDIYTTHEGSYPYIVLRIAIFAYNRIMAQFPIFFVIDDRAIVFFKDIDSPSVSTDP